MNSDCMSVNGKNYRVFTADTVVVGSGAAGYNAALRLHGYGAGDVAIVTKGVCSGTSRNTGSDKQTYYKLNLCGDCGDSPAAMARDLFDGRCVDGDIAMCEAALSAPCFLHLCELGVPFPVNRYGEYVGYKTDHDPRARATSAGPLTSKLMTERLEKAVSEAGIPVYGGQTVIKILVGGGRTLGLLTLDSSGLSDPERRFALWKCRHVVYAVGGPAGIYSDSVYPVGHTGASGAAYEAGARGRNLTEWQYGLASVAPRWNVSGTYMQVLPRFVSVDPDGTEHEFLRDYFSDGAQALSMVFKKGYEWPFDSRKALSGSSRVDLLVYREAVLRGRRVFLDFRSNPFGGIDYSALAPEAREYLEKAGACFGSPIERLEHMNAPAVELYRSKGVDLHSEMLEIALCAQHSNGGIDVNMWWQTALPGLFAVGEAAGTHGVFRPGGSALNAGQVGSMRAAQYIARNPAPEIPERLFSAEAAEALAFHSSLCDSVLSGGDNVGELISRFTSRMSACAAAIRNGEQISSLLADASELSGNFARTVRAAGPSELKRVYTLRDLLITQRMMLTALSDYASHGGLTRGSSLCTSADGLKPEGLEELFRFRPDDGRFDGQVQEILLQNGAPSCQWRPVRPLPESGGFFENVWREYRKNGNVY